MRFGDRVAASAAIATALTFCLLAGCAAEPVETNSVIRDLGTPASDELDDLNLWIENVAVVSGDLSFETGEALLTDHGVAILEGLVDHLRATSGSIKVEGFADGVGGDTAANDQLSEERAEAVKEWLVNHGGIQEERFTLVKGHGIHGEVNGVVAKNGIADPLRRVVQITIE